MGRTVINETENKQTVILNDSAEGIEGGYFDADMVWHELGGDEGEEINNIFAGYDIANITRATNSNEYVVTPTALNYTSHIYGHYCNFKLKDVVNKKFIVDYDYSITGLDTTLSDVGIILSIEVFSKRTVSSGTNERPNIAVTEDGLGVKNINGNGHAHFETKLRDDGRLDGYEEYYVGVICFLRGNSGSTISISNLTAKVRD